MKRTTRLLPVLLTAFSFVVSSDSLAQPRYPTIGRIEKLDPRLDELIDVSSEIEVLGKGFEWAEGPVWVPSQQCLLFSDIPKNVIQRWSATDGVKLFLEPAGFTGDAGSAHQPGSNGLALDRNGRLLLCQHGDRRLAVMMATWEHPEAQYDTLADRYRGKRLNSPNDLTVRSNGDIYFTDPPYGLEQQMDDPHKEIEFQGVYRFDGKRLHLLVDDLTRPNGIAFSPEEQFAYVAVSDPGGPVLIRYPVRKDGSFGAGEIFFNAAVRDGKGLPDGLKVDQSGNLFATGPGGVLVIASDGTHLGTINTTQATANCAFGDDGSTLFMTADMYLLRIKTRTLGCGFSDS